MLTDKTKARIESHKSKNRFSLHKGKREPYRTKKKSNFYDKNREPHRTIIRKRFPFFLTQEARTVPYEKLKSFFVF